MKGIPLPCDFEGKGVLDLDFIGKNRAFFGDSGNCFFTGGFVEPTSVLDSAVTPNRPASSLTLSSSLGGGGGGGGGAVSTDANPFTTATSSNVGGIDSGLVPIPSYLDIGAAAAGGNPVKFAMDEWETVLSDSAAVDHSILRWVIGDVEDPSLGGTPNLNKAPQIDTPCRGLPAAEFNFSGFDGDNLSAGFIFTVPVSDPHNDPGSTIPFNHQTEFDSQQSMFFSPQPKRQILHQEFPHYLQKPKFVYGDDNSQHCNHQKQQQAIVDHLHKAAELVQSGNLILAHEILARLNHQLSPIGKPFHRSALYCKEALQLLLHCSTSSRNNPISTASSPFSLIFKLGAYKSFSEISPIVHFANFSSNQAILEAMEGFDRIHIVDYDIGYGAQWASLMQELGLRNGGAPFVKITAFVSASSHDQLELGLVRENLIQFASQIKIPFEFQVMSIDSLSSGSWLLPETESGNEGVAVNLPFGSLPSMTLILSFLKQLSPKIIVSVETGSDRSDLSFADQIIHVLQSYSNLLESLDSVSVHMNDALQKIERFLLKPGIERIVMTRFRSPDKPQHWKAMLLSCGFSPVMFSNLTESQAECVIKRSPVRGFRVEKKQSSLVLCWQKKEIVSVSAWRCC